MFKEQYELEAVANDILYSGEEIHSELRYRLENLDFDFEINDEGELLITYH